MIVIQELIDSLVSKILATSSTAVDSITWLFNDGDITTYPSETLEDIVRNNESKVIMLRVIRLVEQGVIHPRSLLTGMPIKFGEEELIHFPRLLRLCLNEHDEQIVRNEFPLLKNSTSASAKESRIEEILGVITELGYDPQAIPRDGKQKALSACLKNNQLFTESTFNAAWKQASNQKRLKSAVKGNHKSS